MLLIISVDSSPKTSLTNIDFPDFDFRRINYYIRNGSDPDNEELK